MQQIFIYYPSRSRLSVFTYSLLIFEFYYVLVDASRKTVNLPAISSKR